MTSQFTSAIAAVATKFRHASTPGVQHAAQKAHASYNMGPHKYHAATSMLHVWGVSHRCSCIPRLPWQKHPHGFPNGLLDRGHNAVDELCDSGQAGIAARVRMGTEPHSKARVLDVVAGYEAQQLQWQPEVRLQAAQDLPFLIMQKRRRQLATRCC